MTLIEWSEIFSTGIEEMDSQHKKLIAMVNRIHALLEEGKNEEARDFFVKEIADYIEKHFRDEEEFMRSINFPHFDVHKLAHDNFRNVMRSSISKIEEGDEKEFRSAVSMAWAWLYSHILKVDKKYGEYYRTLKRGED